MKFCYKNIIILIILICTQSIFGQRNKVPVDVQIKVIPKILSLNKTFLNNKVDNLNSMIIYSNEQRNSKQVFDDFNNSLKEKKIIVNSRILKILSFDIKKLKGLRKYIKDNHIKVLYITPIRGVDISSITKICREEDVLTITGVDEYKENMVSVILGLNKSKLQIMINQKSAKSEGANFSSRLLKIATLIE